MVYDLAAVKQRAGLGLGDEVYIWAGGRRVLTTIEEIKFLNKGYGMYTMDNIRYSLSYQDNKGKWGRFNSILQSDLTPCAPAPEWTIGRLIAAYEMIDLHNRKDRASSLFETLTMYANKGFSVFSKLYYAASLYSTIERVLWQNGRFIRHAAHGNILVETVTLRADAYIYDPAG